MSVLSSNTTVGYFVRGRAYHEDCCPNGPTSPILASYEGVENKFCDRCGEPLIEIEDVLDSYEHNDSCDCDDCLVGEAIALSGGVPIKCPTCLEIFDKYSQGACHGKEFIYCSEICWENRGDASTSVC